MLHIVQWYATEPVAGKDDLLSPGIKYQECPPSLQLGKSTSASSAVLIEQVRWV